MGRRVSVMLGADFDRLYRDHAQALFGFLAYRTGNRALAEDLLADTFERAMRSWRRFDPRRGSARAWLSAIAMNLARDHGRRRAAEGRALEEIGAQASATSVSGRQFEELEERDALGRAMSVLSPSEQETLALRYGADLSVREVARVRGESAAAAEQRVYRALRKLRSLLEGQ